MLTLFSKLETKYFENNMNNSCAHHSIIEHIQKLEECLVEESNCYIEYLESLDESTQRDEELKSIAVLHANRIKELQSDLINLYK